jgi:apolipoprotein N-acyltransferase
MRRRHARAGVDLTIVQAAATTFQGTWALPQQASFEAVRAVESGRPAVLVAVSGTSAAFDAQGRRLAWVDQHETGAWTVTVPLSQEKTLFVRWGDWVPAACFVVLVVAAVAACVPLGHRRQRRAPSRPVAQGAP